MVTFHVACQNPARWASNLPFGQDCKDNLGIGDFFNKITLLKKSSEPQNPETPKPSLCCKTKLSTKGWWHLTRKFKGWSLEQMDQAAAWTHPQVLNTSKRPTNHRQNVCLVLPPGWLAKCWDSEVCSKGRVYLPGSQARR